MNNLIKNIFADILMLYKNFIHFNISKIVIFLVSILYWIATLVPFILILLLILLFSIDFDFSNINSLLNNETMLLLFYSPISLIIITLWFISAFFSFMYYFVLQTNLNINYIEKKNLGVTKNFYFNFKLFRKYFSLMFILFFIIISPFILYWIWMFITSFFVWGIEWLYNLLNNWEQNYFTLWILLGQVLTLVLFIYLAYKTLFSFIILVDESKWIKFEWVFSYIKKSFIFTKGIFKFLKFIFIFVLVFLITLPINVPLNYFWYLNEHLWNYIEHKNWVTNSENFYYIQSLEVEFWEKSLDENINDYNSNSIYKILFEILNFLFIFGLFEMVLLSFYKRTKESKNKVVTEKSKKIIPKKSIPKKVIVKKTIVKKNIVKAEEKNEVKIEAVKRWRGRPKKVITDTIEWKKSPKKVSVIKAPVKRTPVKKNIIKVEEKKEVNVEPVKRWRGRPRKIEK